MFTSQKGHISINVSSSDGRAQVYQRQGKRNAQCTINERDRYRGECVMVWHSTELSIIIARSIITPDKERRQGPSKGVQEHSPLEKVYFLLIIIINLNQHSAKTRGGGLFLCLITWLWPLSMLVEFWMPSTIQRNPWTSYQPSIEGHGHDINFQQDNACLHIPRIFHEVLDEHEVVVLTWPDHLPDLSSIVHVWDEIQQCIRAQPQQP